jgi:UDP-GlcNAc:undecaprenyl-phosphate/decaprenyl-phosphate GlcNAc-1-phosphate transferase
MQFYQLYGLMFIASLSATALMTPPIIQLAHSRNIVDQPGLHKTHSESKPLLGGLAIFLGIVLTMFLFTSGSGVSGKLLSILVGAVVLVTTGVFDDIYNLKPLVKLTGQTLAASIVVLYNLGSYRLFFDAFGRFFVPGWLVTILLIGWIVLMINAINLIDGLDGLAAGTGAIIFTSMAVINLINLGNSNMLLLQLAGAGACAGFLFYNFKPAKIFMGDTGSMLIGFLLSTTYLISINGEFSTSLVLGSVFIFGYPALDTTFAILRRLIRRKSIFHADKSHIHHLLPGLGLSVRNTVFMLYLANGLFGVMAVVMLTMELSSYTILSIGLATILFTCIVLKSLSVLCRNRDDLGSEEAGFEGAESA